MRDVSPGTCWSLDLDEQRLKHGASSYISICNRGLLLVLATYAPGSGYAAEGYYVYVSAVVTVVYSTAHIAPTAQHCSHCSAGQGRRRA